MLWLLLACNGTPDPEDSPTPDTADEDTGVHTPDGAFCSPETLIGNIAVQRYPGGMGSFYAQIYDAPSPWIGAPTAESQECAYHSYESVFCEGCQSDEQCSVDGECVATPRTLKGLELELSADGQISTHSADDRGLVWGQLNGEERFRFTLSGPVSIQSEEMLLPEAISATVTSQGDWDAPGELAVSWTGGGEGWVTTKIPINHHANSPTFTSCHASAEGGGFQVPAEMVNPLSVHTGFEFQGLEHGAHAAVQTEAGCVQISVVNLIPSQVDFE